MRSQIPAFRLPVEVLEEEVDRILDMGVICHLEQKLLAMRDLLDQNFDAYFVGTGHPEGEILNSQVERKLTIIFI